MSLSTNITKAPFFNPVRQTNYTLVIDEDTNDTHFVVRAFNPQTWETDLDKLSIDWIITNPDGRLISNQNITGDINLILVDTNVNILEGTPPTAESLTNLYNSVVDPDSQFPWCN